MFVSFALDVRHAFAAVAMFGALALIAARSAIVMRRLQIDAFRAANIVFAIDASKIRNRLAGRMPNASIRNDRANIQMTADELRIVCRQIGIAVNGRNVQFFRRLGIFNEQVKVFLITDAISDIASACGAFRRLDAISVAVEAFAFKMVFVTCDDARQNVSAVGEIRRACFAGRFDFLELASGRGKKDKSQGNYR